MQVTIFGQFRMPSSKLRIAQPRSTCSKELMILVGSFNFHWPIRNKHTSFFKACFIYLVKNNRMFNWRILTPILIKKLRNSSTRYILAYNFKDIRLYHENLAVAKPARLFTPAMLIFSS